MPGGIPGSYIMGAIGRQFPTNRFAAGADMASSAMMGFLRQMELAQERKQRQMELGREYQFRQAGMDRQARLDEEARQQQQLQNRFDFGYDELALPPPTLASPAKSALAGSEAPPPYGAFGTMPDFYTPQEAQAPVGPLTHHVPGYRDVLKENALRAGRLADELEPIQVQSAMLGLDSDRQKLTKGKLEVQQLESLLPYLPKQAAAELRRTLAQADEYASGAGLNRAKTLFATTGGGGGSSRKLSAQEAGMIYNAYLARRKSDPNASGTPLTAEQIASGAWPRALQEYPDLLRGTQLENELAIRQAFTPVEDAPGFYKDPKTNDYVTAEEADARAKLRASQMRSGQVVTAGAGAATQAPQGGGTGLDALYGNSAPSAAPTQSASPSTSALDQLYGGGSSAPAPTSANALSGKTASQPAPAGSRAAQFDKPLFEQSGGGGGPTDEFGRPLPQDFTSRSARDMVAELGRGAERGKVSRRVIIPGPNRPRNR